MKAWTSGPDFHINIFTLLSQENTLRYRIVGRVSDVVIVAESPVTVRQLSVTITVVRTSVKL